MNHVYVTIILLMSSWFLIYEFISNVLIQFLNKQFEGQKHSVHCCRAISWVCRRKPFGKSTSNRPQEYLPQALSNKIGNKYSWTDKAMRFYLLRKSTVTSWSEETKVTAFTWKKLDSNVISVRCQNGVSVMPMWRKRDVGVMSAWCKGDVSVMSPRCQRDVSWMSEWCHRDLSVMSVWRQRNVSVI